VVTLEEGEEGSLSTGSTLDTTESDVVASALDVAKVPEELLQARKGSAVNLGLGKRERRKQTWIQRVARLPTVVS
jgi:hypothetical protein